MSSEYIPKINEKDIRGTVMNNSMDLGYKKHRLNLSSDNVWNSVNYYTSLNHIFLIFKVYRVALSASDISVTIM